ncbi:uncharacterized protein LOC126762379 [Bactrocera neohumeralis]|uniref:uncharacterized protein LOC120779297 n=1 Tax=Bactrocera tryoni TaxID=59916 RepID=UPI001A97C745|nr:uncharacterized protein LOC120779297 [Bactrocera tryoni]XP_050335063.1 uncharacterized protein LOC126762379 [Bactrocera neohumeralis]
MNLGTFPAFITGFYLLTQLASAIAYMKFTNLKCENYDKSFMNFRKCDLKALSRNKVALTMDIQLFQLPIRNFSVNLDVYKKANGYRPFLFNITTNFCQFFKNKKRLPFGKLIMDILEIYSNINHSCPYNHDFIVKDLVLQTEQLQSLPVPTGEYLLRITSAFYNVWKYKVDTYIQIVEE